MFTALFALTFVYIILLILRSFHQWKLRRVAIQDSWELDTPNDSLTVLDESLDELDQIFKDYDNWISSSAYLGQAEPKLIAPAKEPVALLKGSEFCEITEETEQTADEIISALIEQIEARDRSNDYDLKSMKRKELEKLADELGVKWRNTREPKSTGGRKRHMLIDELRTEISIALGVKRLQSQSDEELDADDLVPIFECRHMWRY